MDILLVDDERLARLCTQSMLSELLPEGCVYHHAANAQQAREYLSQNVPPALCVVDYKMPLCSGLEFIRSIQPLYPQTLWVLLSGYDLTEQAEEIRAAHIEHTLSKPASLADFYPIAARLT